MKRLELFFLTLLVPISFFTVILNVPSFVPGYLAISTVTIVLFLTHLVAKSGKIDLGLSKIDVITRNFMIFMLSFIIFVLVSTFISIDLGKTLRGLFLVFVLVILVYFLYRRNISSKNQILLYNIMVGTVVLYQAINSLIIFFKIPVPSLFPSGVWEYLIRSNGVFHHNVSGLMIAFTIPALVKVTYLSKAKLKPLYLAIGVLLVMGLVFSTSRASILSVLVYGTVLLCLMFRKYFKIILAAFISILIGVFLVFQILPESISKMFRMHQGLSSRELLWAKGMEMLQQKPWFGYGFRTVPEVQNGNIFQNFHNLYLGMAVELGLLAAITFLVLVFYYLFVATKKALNLKDKEAQIIAFSCIAFITSAMVHQFFEQMLFFFGTHYYATIYLLIYLAVLNSKIFNRDI